MSSSATVKFAWDNARVNNLRTGVYKGILKMAFDIQERAMDRAPVLTGDLRSSIRTEAKDSGASVDIIAGGTIGKSTGIVVDYAEVREFSNNLHPDTVHYMQNALKDVTSGDYIKKYFGGTVL